MSGRRILILSSSHLCRNPRVVKEATTLGAAGYDVTVMSVSAHAAFEQTDLELMRGLPFRRQVLDFSGQSSRARIAGFIQRSRTWAARALCKQLKFESAQSLGPAQALLRFARSHPADLTIVHTEIPTWAAQFLLRDGRRVAADVEDWYSQDLPFADQRSRPIGLLREAERFVLNRAAYVSATSESMARELAAFYGCPVPVVIRNTFPLQPDPRTGRATGATPPAFIWFSQTIGPGRGLELFFAAWARTRNPSRVYLLGDERAGYRAHLLERLPPERRGDVHFLPPVPPHQLPGKLAEFDLGLALEQRWPRNRDVTITNKIFQYLNAGLALIATDTAGQSEVLRDAPASGLLLQAHETTANTQSIDQLLGDPDRLRRCQSAAREAARTKFCWERDAQQLLNAVEGALAPAKSSAN